MSSNCTTLQPIPDDILVTNAWCNTRIQSTTINYTWTINNFSLRPEKIGEPLISPTFSDGVNKNIKWNLRIYPKGNNEANKDFVSIYLELASCNKSELQVNFRLYTSTNTVESTRIFTPTKLWGPPNFIRRSTLFAASKKILPDDILTVSCNVSFLSDSGNTTNLCGASNSVEVVDAKSKLIQDFGNLFDNGEFSDVTIVVDDHEIRAHKAILAARNSYFAAMFKNETQESQLSRIVVTDVEHDVLKELLNFIYTGKTPNLDEMAAKLLPAADKYGLESLKLLSEESLRAALSIENAIETFILADIHNAVQLKSFAKEFIKYHISEIIETSGWRNLITTKKQNMLISIEPSTKLDKDKY